jgi:protoporphyrinogen/coproporphyrinogen III oxidase
MADKGIRIAVVGGGICGLAAAHRLRELHPDWQLTLLEATDRVGGILKTEKRDGFLIEHSADMFSTREPWALALCQRLGIADELIRTNDENRRAFIVRNGKLRRVPEGLTILAPKNLPAIMRSPIMSLRGRLRLAMEYFVAARTEGGDESFSSFAKRRFGKEAFEKLLQPIVAGIYTADPDKLSMEACLNEFAEMERSHGGVLRALLAMRKQSKREPEKESGARYGSFLAPRSGMQRLVDKLVGSIGPSRVHYRWPVEELQATSEGKWRLRRLGNEETADFDGVVLAATAKQSASLLSGIAPAAAADLVGIEHAGASIVVAGYHRAAIRHKLDGFGFVVPRIENRRVLAGSFSSIKFAGRAPKDHVLIRFFVGGALQPQLVDVDGQELVEIVRDDVRDLLHINRDAVFMQVLRWRGRMPQYHLGHLARVSRIESSIARLPRLELASNALRGVGIPACVRSGELAAEKLAQKMKTIGEEFDFPPRKPR